MNIKDKFITLYFNNLRLTPLFKEMEKISEETFWHRETNILVHTDMVISQYLINPVGPITNNNNWILGAMACAFHDVGKPSCLEYKNSPERGDYKAFSGHELVSARLWEDYAITNWNVFKDIITPSDICNIAWLIENHLPYKLQKDYKLGNLYCHDLISTGILTNVLLADTYGRISDDHEQKKSDVKKWIFNLSYNIENIEYVQNFMYRKNNTTTNPILYMPIGASGSGKSTFCKTLDVDENNYFSLDKIRLELYSQDYPEAYKMSCEDNKFQSKYEKIFRDILKTNKNCIVDNTNLSKNGRRFYLTNAEKNGYKTVAVVFPTDLKTIIDRQKTRSDKEIPEEVVKKQFIRLQQPSLGEFDDIIYNSQNIVEL